MKYPFHLTRASGRFRPKPQSKTSAETTPTDRSPSPARPVQSTADNHEQVIGVPVTYVGDNPIGHVVSLNLQRRRLTESQRAMVASAISNLSKGQNARFATDRSIDLSVTQPQAAEMLNVGETVRCVPGEFGCVTTVSPG